ncbi:MAG: 6-phosphofructokinase [Clostridiales bacterium]|jgi:6-phosphofructokinase 1|nr:6-phosphofructokinase [Clostridiales bacterium]
MPDKQRKIGVLTSGGDAPGMNAVIRAVTRAAIYYNVRVYGIRKGYDGLFDSDWYELNQKSVSDIIHRGGTILKTGRSADMMKPEGAGKAALVCGVLGLDALVTVGGDGTARGALALSERGVNVFHVPATIDLDMPCTEYTIGFDTAVNTGMDAINKIRDTSSSHERVSVVEVMGRDAGQLALWCGMAGGAEEVLIPENTQDGYDAVIRLIINNRVKGKSHNLILVAEGVGGAQELAERIEHVTGITSRATILGYLQRGGSPTALDRMHAAMMGLTAVERFLAGDCNKAIIYKNGGYGTLDIKEAVSAEKRYDSKLYDAIKILAV